MTFTFSIPPGFRLIGLEETAKGFRAYLKRRDDASGMLQGAVDLTPDLAIQAAHQEFLRRETTWRMEARVETPPKVTKLNFTLDLSGIGKPK